ncbi:hypothetical protein [Streptomyces katsurahamanus]|uniref:Uncharacterized protein n=1 Tax=Streptomyces katsurahamanus TaxID=2577098 RepID=A0ABW9NN53_9ACTN|nr:hypothetical protein [Streptomyces katsurahamanus]MQS34745.1 hypothetical protein [Streptomyces katsurahamanus]
MTVRGRQRGEQSRGTARDQAESTGAWAFAVLAVLGMAAPAWVLRGEAAELLGAGLPVPISAPDTGTESG